MDKNIIFFQENTNCILDLAAELSYDEVGLYMILKATYIKYGGVVPVKKLKKYCHYQGSSKKLQNIIKKTLTIEDDLYVNVDWNRELKRIKNISEKARNAVKSRWAKRDAEQAKWGSFKDEAGINNNTDVYTDVDTDVDTDAYTNREQGTNSNNTKNSIITKAPKKFKKPTLDEIKDYCLERKNSVDPDKFINYYDSNGWKVGRNPMKSWQAAIRTWEKSNFDKSVNTGAVLTAMERAAIKFEGGMNDTTRI